MAVFTPVLPAQKEILLGEGFICANFGTANEIRLGATRGDSVFTVTRTIRDIPVDGTYGSIKGMRRLTEEKATLKVAALEVVSNANKLFAGTSIITGTDNAGGTYGAVGYHAISSDLDIADADYYTNVAFVGWTKEGEPIATVIKNALGDGNIAYAFKNNDEVVAETTFTAHYAASGTPTSIWEIRYYDDIVASDTTPPTVTVSPLDSATEVAVTANIVWTFNEAIDPNTVTDANFMLIKASDGSQIAGSLTYNSTHTVVTFDPTASLTGSAAAYMAIANTNITDTAGNHLAATSIVNFVTTA
jgi:hypothetical protein